MKNIPLVRPTLPTVESINADLSIMLQSGRLTNFGPFSSRLENRISEMLGVKYAICVSNATTGLMLALSMLPRGSEVLLPSFTFLPTVQAVLWNGLIPVFVDIDRWSYTLSCESIESKLSAKTSAILAVHTFGNPCDVERIDDIGKRAGIKVFYDSAHAFGAKHGGRYLGGFGDAEVFSLSATKLLPCGEGGVLTTNSDVVAEAILNGRNYGFALGTRDCHNLGLNGKITEFSAILGLHELESIDQEVRERNHLAMKYRERLGRLPGIEFQSVPTNNLSTYKDFTILIDPSAFGVDRDELKSQLMKEAIETDAYFSPPIHRMTLFGGAGASDRSLSTTEYVEKLILSLPIYGQLSEDDQERVIATLERLCSRVLAPINHPMRCRQPVLSSGG